MSYSNYHPQFLSTEDWEPQNREITGRSPLSERDNIISLTIHRKRYLNGDRNNCEMNTQKVTLISDRCRVQLTSQTQLVIPSTPNIPSTPFLRGTNVLLDHNTVPNATPPQIFGVLQTPVTWLHGSCSWFLYLSPGTIGSRPFDYCPHKLLMLSTARTLPKGWIVDPKVVRGLFEHEPLTWLVRSLLSPECHMAFHNVQEKIHRMSHSTETNTADITVSQKN